MDRARGREVTAAAFITAESGVMASCQARGYSAGDNQDTNSRASFVKAAPLAASLLLLGIDACASPLPVALHAA